MIQHRVPANAEIVAIEATRGHEARTRLRTEIDSVFPPRRLPGAEVMDVESQRPADPADSDLAVQLRIDLPDELYAARPVGDRKSTRLNSSHLGIPYAV